MSAKASLLVLVAGLVGLASFRGSPTAAEPPVHLSSGHSHDNLTVFILRGTDVLDSKHILTLQEALEKNLCIVHETSSVNMLEVENLSPDHELFLQSGDIVKGGKQDRLVSQDLLIQAKSGRVPCPANCCEQSRWQQRGGEAAGKFEKSTDFAVGNDIKIANVAKVQRAVWDNVAKKQADLSKNVGKPVTENASPTSLQLALEDKDLRAKVAAYERDLGGLANAYPDAVGVVIAVNGQVIASDVYGSRLLFQKAWPKLLKSAAADAVAQMPTGEVVVATREEAAKFLVSRASNGSDGANFDLTNTDRGLESELQNDLPVDRLEDVTAQRPVVLDSPVGNDARRSRGGPAAIAGFAGRSGATREHSLATAGGRNDQPVPPNALRSLAQNEFTAWQIGFRVDIPLSPAASSPAPPPQPAVVSFESRAGAQGNALIHRGQLKK